MSPNILKSFFLTSKRKQNLRLKTGTKNGVFRNEINVNWLGLKELPNDGKLYGLESFSLLFTNDPFQSYYSQRFVEKIEFEIKLKN